MYNRTYQKINFYRSYINTFFLVSMLVYICSCETEVMYIVIILFDDPIINIAINAVIDASAPYHMYAGHIVQKRRFLLLRRRNEWNRFVPNGTSGFFLTIKLHKTDHYLPREFFVQKFRRFTLSLNMELMEQRSTEKY